MIAMTMSSSSAKPNICQLGLTCCQPAAHTLRHAGMQWGILILHHRSNTAAIPLWQEFCSFRPASAMMCSLTGLYIFLFKPQSLAARLSTLYLLPLETISVSFMIEPAAAPTEVDVVTQLGPPFIGLLLSTM